MPSSASEYDIAVGKVVAAHGLKGEVRVAPLSDVPNRAETLHEVMARGPRGEQLLKISRLRDTGKGTWIIWFEGISERNGAEALRGSLLLVRAIDSPPLPEDCYYIHDIIGLEVVTTAGRHLGPITEVLETGANDVYVTAGGLIPAIQQVVKEVNLAAGTMIIEPIAGMLPDLEPPPDGEGGAQSNEP